MLLGWKPMQIQNMRPFSPNYLGVLSAGDLTPHKGKVPWQSSPAELGTSHGQSPQDSACWCPISLTFENLCEQEENCRISTVKSSSLVSSSSSVSMWWYFSDRAVGEGLGVAWVTQRVSVFNRDNYTTSTWSRTAWSFLGWGGTRSESVKLEMNYVFFKCRKGQRMSDNARTIKITCVILWFQLGNKFRLLSQQTVPV